MARGRPIDLAHRVQQLVAERQKHAAALELIDQTLGPIRTMLLGVENGANEIADQPIDAASNGRETEAATPRRRRRRGRRGSYATTADEMILALVREQGHSTTREIKERWKVEGRGGTADNALSKLVKDRKLKRLPLDGQRGSRFTLS